MTSHGASEWAPPRPATGSAGYMPRWLNRTLLAIAVLLFVVPSYDSAGTLLKSQNLLPLLLALLLLLRAPHLRLPTDALAVVALLTLPLLIALQAIPTILVLSGLKDSYSLAGPSLPTVAKQLRDPLAAWLALLLLLGNHRQLVSGRLVAKLVAFSGMAGAAALLLHYVIAPMWAGANYVNPRGFLAGFEGPNSLGAGVALLIPFGVAWLVGATSKRGRLMALASLAVLGALLMLSGSRGAVVALVGSSALAVLLAAVLGKRASLKRYVLAPVLAAAVIAGLLLAPTGPITRLARTDLGSLATDLSTARRVIQLETALGLVTAHPLSGVGLGGFEEAYLALNPGVLGSTTPHNALLFIGAQAGLIGIFVLVAFYLVLAVLSIRAFSAIRNAWGMAALGFPANLVMLDLFFPYTFTHDVGVLVVILIAVVYVMGAEKAGAP